MRMTLLALVILLASCEKDKDPVTPDFNPMEKMYFAPVYSGSAIIGTKFIIPVPGKELAKIVLSKNGNSLDSLLNVRDVATLYDTITPKFPQHDSTFVFTITTEGKTTTSSFRVP
jgi:hypothetical protein